VFLDGSLFSETAALSEDYCAHAHGADRGSGARDGGHGADDAHRGYFQADPDHLRQQILAAYRSGWSIAAHAIGDRAVDLALALITECRQLYGPPTLPNRIEHATVTRPEHLAKMVAAQVAVTPQSSFFRSMGDAMTASLGPERATTPTAGPGTQAQPPTGAPHRRALLDRSLETVSCSPSPPQPSPAPSGEPTSPLTRMPPTTQVSQPPACSQHGTRSPKRLMCSISATNRGQSSLHPNSILSRCSQD